MAGRCRREDTKQWNNNNSNDNFIYIALIS